MIRNLSQCLKRAEPVVEYVNSIRLGNTDDIDSVVTTCQKFLIRYDRDFVSRDFWSCRVVSVKGE